MSKIYIASLHQEYFNNHCGNSPKEAIISLVEELKESSDLIDIGSTIFIAISILEVTIKIPLVIVDGVCNSDYEECFDKLIKSIYI